MSRIVVIGGGVSGLSCARGLADRLSGSEIRLLEAAPLPGGTIRTIRSHGFRLEVGPNGWLNRHPSTLALSVRLGLEADLITACEERRRRFVFVGERLARFPDSPATFFGSDLLSVRARLRILLEPLVRPARSGVEETVGQFARRRLGREGAAHLFEPVIYGIYAGDPDRLSLREALPQVGALEKAGRSLLGSYLESRRRVATEAGGLSPAAIGRSRLVSFREGVGALIEALAASLGPSLRCDSPVQAVVRDGRKLRVVVGGPQSEEISADAVIFAAPADAAAACLRDLDADLAAACAGIPYSPVAVLGLGYREADVPHPLDGHGHLVSGRERSGVLGVHWTSSVFPGHRCPPGMVVLQPILGGARDPRACERTDDALADLACAHLERALGITAAPVHVRVFRHWRGLPQYVVGHGRRREVAAERVARIPGLFLTGNAWRGVGMNACTADAERVVDEVARALGSPQRSPWEAGVRARA